MPDGLLSPPGSESTHVRPSSCTLRPMIRRAAQVAVGLMVAACLVPAGALGASLPSGGIEDLQVGGPLPVHPIESGYLGLSIEFPALARYAGSDPAAPNPVFLQLIRNLTPGQAPVLRIGGDSTDRTWWPVAGMRRPAGVRNTLGPRWLAVTRAVARSLRARLILGINLEADSSLLARAEEKAFLAGIGPASIQALEPGNEPELYSSWTYYRTRSGVKVSGRPASYGFTDFTREFGAFATLLGPEPIAGPALGSISWMNLLPSFLASEPRLRLVTVHRYPLQLCFIPPEQPQYPSIAHLLSPNSSRGLANSVRSYVALAHRHRMKLRVDEMNTNGCGAAPGVDATFASALWALDTLFAMAGVGVDGVNVHTYPGASYQLFRFDHSDGQWQGTVQPEYYGLLFFALAAPPHSQPLAVSGQATADLSTWATAGPDGQTRVVLINDSPDTSRIVSIEASAPLAMASVLRLQAPSLTATDGITLGGQSFDPNTGSGRLSGSSRTGMLAPLDGRYLVNVPAGSAALVVLP
jgi:hypothetical protein